MSILCLIKPLAYFSLPAFALHHLSKTSPLTRYYVRLGVYLSTMGLCSAWGLVLAVGMNLIGDPFNVNFIVARTFYALASRALGITMTLEGEEYLDTCPAVYVGNHQSMLDILYLGRIFPKRASIMAKKELQWMPLLGQWMWLSGAIFIDRGNNARAIRSLTAAGETIKARRTSLWMFPEGTRFMNENADLRTFKKGAFHLAVEAGIPIVPVVCENYWRLYRKGIFNEGPLKIKVLPPIPTTGLTASDVNALSIRVREVMLEALREISVPGSSPAAAPEKTPATKPAPDVAPAALPQSAVPQSRSESRASTHASEDNSPPSSRHEGSEAGVETEEDEGMVLVGRPPQ